MSRPPEEPGGPDEAAFGSELRRHLRAEAIKVPRELMTRSAASSAASIAFAHAWLAVAVLVGRFVPWHPLAVVALAFPSILVAQRCLQTLVHHLSHDFLSKRRGINDRLGNWLVAGFIGMRIENYRRVHFVHHAENGSVRDPEFIDFAVVRARGGLVRYVVHFALAGEALALIRKYYLGGGRRAAAPPAAVPARKAAPATGGLARRAVEMVHVVGCQAVVVALFVAVAEAWYLYLVWLYVAVSWSPMLSRLRFLVEHPGKGDLTVSSLAPRWERLLFAPFEFNYHFEHHAWPGVPHYRLHRVHGHLAGVGFFERHPEYRGGSFIGALARRGGERGAVAADRPGAPDGAGPA